MSKKGALPEPKTARTVPRAVETVRARTRLVRMLETVAIDGMARLSGALVELPRWRADDLVQRGLAEYQ